MILGVAFTIITGLAVALVIINLRVGRYMRRLQQKDRMISILIRALPALFVENYRDSDIMKDRDGSFVFHIQTRPEYDGKFIEAK